MIIEPNSFYSIPRNVLNQLIDDSYLDQSELVGKKYRENDGKEIIISAEYLEKNWKRLQSYRMSKGQRHEHKLLDVAAILHGTYVCSVQGFQSDQLNAYARFLQLRMDEWKEPSTSYDLTVKILCTLALEEYAAYLQKQIEELQ
jgi:hypothetical protein